MIEKMDDLHPAGADDFSRSLYADHIRGLKTKINEIIEVSNKTIKDIESLCQSINNIGR